jgi:hypothetical protein
VGGRLNGFIAPLGFRKFRRSRLNRFIRGRQQLQRIARHYFLRRCGLRLSFILLLRRRPFVYHWRRI